MLVIIILSFLFQSLKLASMGLTRKNLGDFDNMAGNTANVDNNKGYVNSVISNAIISAIIYIYLMIAKGCQKSCSEIVDWVVLHGVVMIQFGIGVTLAAYLTNNKRSYDTAQDSYNTSN